MAQTIQAEIDILIRKLNAVSDQAKKDSRQALGEGAKPLISAIKANAPVSDEPHSRWSGGKKVATYYPGNLKRSVKKLVFRRSAAVFVGPRIKSFGANNATGDFKGNRTDAYYAHLMEFEYGLGGKRPQPFIRPAAESVGPAALNIAAKALKRKIDAYARRISI